MSDAINTFGPPAEIARSVLGKYPGDAIELSDEQFVERTHAYQVAREDIKGRLQSLGLSGAMSSDTDYSAALAHASAKVDETDLIDPRNAYQSALGHIQIVLHHLENLILRFGGS